MINFTHVVTFRRRDGNGAPTWQTGPVPVTIQPVLADERKQQAGTLFRWQVQFPTTVLLNGLPLQPDDEIVWSGVDEGYAALHMPAPAFGSLASATAYFDKVR